MKVENILEYLDVDIEGDDSVEFYLGAEKIGYFNQCEIVSETGILKLLNSKIERISGGIDKQSIRIFITDGDGE